METTSFHGDNFAESNREKLGHGRFERREILGWELIKSEFNSLKLDRRVSEKSVSMDHQLRKRKRKREREVVSIIDYLPEELLSQILSHLNHIDLKSTSLVSKLFRSLSCPFVHKLTLRHSYLIYSDFQRLFRRFPGVKKINIKFCQLDDDSLLSAISDSGLNLEKLRFPPNMRINALYPEQQTTEIMSKSSFFRCFKSKPNVFYCHPEQPVIKFVNLFPSLIGLDFSYCLRLNDEDVHTVTWKLQNLQKINLNFCHSLSDKALAILSSNCPKLEAVNFQKCSFTPEALYEFFCNYPQLSSVDMALAPYFDSTSISKVVECMQILKNLNRLSLQDNVEDVILIAIAKSRPPLKRLKIGLSLSTMYTMIGLSTLLSKCPGLETLDIHLPIEEQCSNHDVEMSIALKRLPKLKRVKVWSCNVVCQATLMSLIENCPLLETILFERYDRHPSVRPDHVMIGPTKKNYSIKWMTIPESAIWLRSMVELYCPNLRN